MPTSVGGRLPRSYPLIFGEGERLRLTHQLFRFPAKFHPPVARALISRFTQPGQTVLDPFCGSGTLLVEAALAERNSIGLDIDPLATFVSSVKVRPIPAAALAQAARHLLQGLQSLRRTATELEHLKHNDIDRDEFEAVRASLDVPAIPNLEHWFRRYVAIDLSLLRQKIEEAGLPESHEAFFLLCFAAIIRSASNADPVPVSGLEVTSHMRRLDDAGRTIDVYALFDRKVRRALADMAQYSGRLERTPKCTIHTSDARVLADRITRKVDAVITSPPYHGAVDYYRRHQLEMYWLRLVDSHEQRLALLKHYVGRPKIPMRDAPSEAETGSFPGVARLSGVIAKTSPERARAFRHYCWSMHGVFEQLGRRVRAGGPAVLVVGNSTWNQRVLNTAALFAEIAHPVFNLEARYSYPVKNRYMSYDRHNGASIETEHVLVFRREA